MAKQRAPLDFGFDVPPEDAIKYARLRQVMLPDEYYGQIANISRASSFSVSYLVSLSQVNKVRRKAQAALNAGETFREFQQGVIDRGVDSLKPAHLETVFRNFTQNGYNAGRWKQHASNPRRPYLMYDAVNDSRTRPEHSAMDGRIFPASSAVWKQWYPPNGHNCRCTVISLTERQAIEEGFKPGAKIAPPEFAPDMGWDYNPGDAYGPRLVKVVQKAEASIIPKPKPAKVPVAKKLEAADPENWKAIPNTQKGSNEGALYDAPDGSQFYVKFPKDPLHAKHEIAAANISGLFGVETLEPFLVSIGGRTGIATKWRDDLRPLTVAERNKPSALLAQDMGRVFGAGVVTKNWDVVGLDFDNLVVSKTSGRLVLVDAGGSFRFRAQGGEKAFLGDIAEVESFYDAKLNPQAAKVFGAMRKADAWAERAANEGLKKLTAAKAKSILEKAGIGADAELLESLMARRAALSDRYDMNGRFKPKNWGAFTKPGEFVEELKQKLGPQTYKGQRRDVLGAVFANEARDKVFNEIVPLIEKKIEELGVPLPAVRGLFGGWSSTSSGDAGGVLKLWAYDRFKAHPGFHNATGARAITAMKKDAQRFSEDYDVPLDKLLEAVDIEYEAHQFYLRKIHGWDSIKTRRYLDAKEMETMFERDGEGRTGAFTFNGVASTAVRKGVYGNVSEYGVLVENRVEMNLKTWYQGPEYMRYQGTDDHSKVSGPGEGDYEFEYLAIGIEPRPATVIKDRGQVFDGSGVKDELMGGPRLERFQY